VDTISAESHRGIFTIQNNQGTRRVETPKATHFKGLFLFQKTKKARGMSTRPIVLIRTGRLRSIPKKNCSLGLRTASSVCFSRAHKAKMTNRAKGSSERVIVQKYM
jgi:hypothetical protein